MSRPYITFGCVLVIMYAFANVYLRNPVQPLVIVILKLKLYCNGEDRIKNNTDDHQRVIVCKQNGKRVNVT